MVASIGTVSLGAIANDRLAVNSLYASSGTRGATSLELPDGLEAGSLFPAKQTLDTATARVALTKTIAAGNAILATLKALRALVKIAADDGLVSANTELMFEETRVSRLNIHTQAQLAIAQIDEVTEAAQFNYVKLISSKGYNVSLQTSAYGGSLTIVPQPLDSVGLGIADLELISDDGVDKALDAINGAIMLAGNRLVRLKALNGALSGVNPFTSAIADLTSGAKSSNLPRGSLVNLVG